MSLLDLPSPMTGAVLEVLVGPGEAITLGQELLIIESMKMEIPIESPTAGTISEVLVEPRQKVSEGTPLLRIDPA